MRIRIVGDLHGDFERLSLMEKGLTKEDILIIAGDFGFIFNAHEYENKIAKLSKKKYQILFVDGNHENFDVLESFPTCHIYGGKARCIGRNIYHLMRGEIYDINNIKFLSFGGAKSIDKAYRREGFSWWPNEIPNDDELTNAISNLEKYDNKVDYVITHTVTSDVFKAMKYSNLGLDDKFHDETLSYLNRIEGIVNRKKWFFGHFHLDFRFRDFIGLYNEWYEIEID